MGASFSATCQSFSLLQPQREKPSYSFEAIAEL